MRRGRDATVLKFGGASLDEPRRIEERLAALRARRRPVVLVVSARGGVTDRLKEMLEAPQDRRGHRIALARIVARHPGLPRAGQLEQRRLERLTETMEEIGSVDLPFADRFLSQGERLAAHWLSERLRAAKLRATPLEADQMGLITDNAYGHASILFDRSRPGVVAAIEDLLGRGEVPVVTGYFGRSLEGRVATLGRGGSDYSATAIASLIGARRVELVKREVSVLSADPKLVPAARPIERLSYQEAEELAQFGARVLHPLTVEPALAAGIEIVVRSLDDPRVATTIGPRAGGGARAMRAITLLSPVAIVRVRVPGGRQRPGVVAEATERLAVHGINIVTLFTSSSLLVLVVERARARRVREVLSTLFRPGPAIVEGPVAVALVTAIGEGILQDLARIPSTTLARGEGLSASPRSLSFAVPVEEGRSAVRSLHRALVEEANR